MLCSTRRTVIIIYCAHACFCGHISDSAALKRRFTAKYGVLPGSHVGVIRVTTAVGGKIEVDVHKNRLPFTVFDLKTTLFCKHGLLNVGIFPETPETKGRRRPLPNSEALEYSVYGGASGVRIASILQPIAAVVGKGERRDAEWTREAEAVERAVFQKHHEQEAWMAERKRKMERLDRRLEREAVRASKSAAKRAARAEAAAEVAAFEEFLEELGLGKPAPKGRILRCWLCFWVGLGCWRPKPSRLKSVEEWADEFRAAGLPVSTVDCRMRSGLLNVVFISPGRVITHPHCLS